MRNTRTRHFVSVAALVALSTLVLYFVFTAMFALPTPASEEAGPIDTLFQIHFGLIAFLFALIMVIMLYAAYVFRRQPGDETDGPHIHGHTALEVIWTIIPTIIVVVMGIYAATVLSDVTRAEPNEVAIKVEGQQWSWRFEYPEHEDAASPELVLLVDQPVVLQMTSLDVLHSFWVPEFRVKQDLLPGEQHIKELRFTPTQVGEYKVRCAEICGTGHADMRATVRVLPQAEYTAWVDDITTRVAMSELSPEERGELWYGAEGFACNACHSIDGSTIVGPTWLDLYGKEEQLSDGTTVVVDDVYIHESIVEPNAEIVAGFNPGIMPQNYEERFAEREAEILATEGIEIDIVDDLISFIRTLDE